MCKSVQEVNSCKVDVEQIGENSEKISETRYNFLFIYALEEISKFSCSN
jgi:hypothetical protein